MTKRMTRLCVSLAAVAAAAIAQVPAAEDVRRVDDALPLRAPVKPKKPRKILVTTLTMRNGQPWKSSSASAIPVMSYALEQMGRRTGAYQAVFDNDVEMFRPERLKAFDAVCFANTAGVLFEDMELRESLLSFVAGGKGLIGIHDAIATFVQYPKYDQWPSFGQMLGGTENGGHPWNGEVMTLKAEDAKHPLVKMFRGLEFKIADQAFQLQEPSFRDRLRVLLSIDTSKTDMNQGRCAGNCAREDGDYPVSWIRQYGKGRVFYSSVGHNPYVFWTPQLLGHFLAGIQFALGDLEADVSPVPARKNP